MSLLSLKDVQIKVTKKEDAESIANIFYKNGMDKENVKINDKEIMVYNLDVKVETMFKTIKLELPDVSFESTLYEEHSIDSAQWYYYAKSYDNILEIKSSNFYYPQYIGNWLDDDWEYFCEDYDLNPDIRKKVENEELILVQETIIDGCAVTRIIKEDHPYTKLTKYELIDGSFKETSYDIDETVSIFDKEEEEQIIKKQLDSYEEGECSDKKELLYLIENDKYRLEKNGITSIAPLAFASSELQDDKECVLASVKKDGSLLQYASPRLKKDEEIVLEAIKHDHNYLVYFADESLKDNQEFMKKAIEVNSNCIKHTSKKVKNDKKLARELILKGAYIGYFGNDVKLDKELNLLFISLDPIKNYFGTSKKMRTDIDIAVAGIVSKEEAKKDRYWKYNYIIETPKELFENKEFALRALKINSDLYKQFSKELQEDSDVLTIVNNC